MIRVIFLLNFKGIKQLSSSLGDGGEKKTRVGIDTPLNIWNLLVTALTLQNYTSVYSNCK